MPITPYVLYGTVTDEDSSTISNARVVAHNVTNSERIDIAADSDGKYVLDLANLASGYSNGDTINVYVRSNGYSGESTNWTLSGEGGIIKNVSVNNQVTVSNFRDKGWYVFKKTLEAGTFAITMTDIDGVSKTNADNILGQYNDKLISEGTTNKDALGFPVVILYTPIISRKGITVDHAQQECDVNFLIEIYHVANRNVKQLTDDVENQIWRAQEVWNGIGLGNLDMPSGDVDVWDEGKKKIHRISLNVNFKFDGVVDIP